MNSKIISVIALGAAGLFAGASAFAQDQQQPIGAPPPPPQSAPPAGVVPPPNVTPTQADRVVYSTQLPSVQQIMQMAQAQGLNVQNVNESSFEVTVTYRMANNTTRTISYQLLPTEVGPNDAAAQPVTVVQSAPPPPPPPQTVVVESAPPPPTVVYRYYDRSYDPFYYDPFYWPRRAPVSINLGFGWSNYRGYRGGYWGGHSHWRHGGHRRW